MRGEEYLTKNEQYGAVYAGGRLKTGVPLSIRYIPNEFGFSRYGFIVSKRVGKAVVRNRVKRRLREILRQTSLKPGWDVVFYTRPAAAAAGFNELRSAALSLLKKARLLMEDHEKACSGAD